MFTLEINLPITKNRQENKNKNLKAPKEFNIPISNMPSFKIYDNMSLLGK